jgi:hypothetical protein
MSHGGVEAGLTIERASKRGTAVGRLAEGRTEEPRPSIYQLHRDLGIMLGGQALLLNRIAT